MLSVQVSQFVSLQAYALNWAIATLVRPVSWVASLGSARAMHNIRRAFAITGPWLSRVPDGFVITPLSTVTASGDPLKGEWVMAPGTGNSARVVLYFHGGGYFFGNPQHHRPITTRLSETLGCRVFSLDYRMAPEHTFTQWTQDALTAYQYVLDKGFAPADIFISGDSAGGHLTLVTLQLIKKMGLPLPAAGIVLSPWTDLSDTSESMHDKEWRDPMIPAAAVVAVAHYISVGYDPRDHRVSPIYGDFSGLPPLFVAIGSTEVLREDCRRFVRRAREAGVPVHYEEWHRMVHVFPLFSDVLPEGRRLFRHVGRFVAQLPSLRAAG